MKREAQKGRPRPLKIQQQQEGLPQPHQHHHHHPHRLHRTHNRPHPLIIHTFSPQIIQTDTAHFMNLVQRLTGASSPFPKRARLAPSEGALHPRHRLDADPRVSFPDSASTVRQQQEMRPASEPQSLPPFPQQASLQTAPSPIFDFSPSLLPSPSSFISRAAGFPPLLSPATTPTRKVGAAPLALPQLLPSPGPLTAKFYMDLPALSPPAAYTWMERSPFAASGGAMFPPVFSPGRRMGLPPNIYSNF